MGPQDRRLVTENRMDQRDQCCNVPREGKEALEQPVGMCSAAFNRDFNKNFTLCSHALVSLSMKMLL